MPARPWTWAQPVIPGRTSCRRHPRVVAADRDADADRVGAELHRPQLEQLELGAVEADAALPIDHRPAAAQLDRNRGDQQDRRESQQDQDRDSYVEDSWDLVHLVPSAFSQVPGAPRRARSQSPAAIEAVVIA